MKVVLTKLPPPPTTTTAGLIESMAFMKYCIAILSLEYRLQNTQSLTSIFIDNIIWQSVDLHIFRKIRGRANGHEDSIIPLKTYEKSLLENKPLQNLEHND